MFTLKDYGRNNLTAFQRVSKRKANNKEFNLGRFCARRGLVFHQFSHWEVRKLSLSIAMYLIPAALPFSNYRTGVRRTASQFF